MLLQKYLLAAAGLCCPFLCLAQCTSAPSASLLTIVSEGPDVCPGVAVEFGARYNGSCTNFIDEGITNVTWTVSPTPTSIEDNAGMAGCAIASKNNSGVLITFPSSPTLYNVTITATNACGTSGSSSPYVVTVESCLDLTGKKVALVRALAVADLTRLVAWTK
jgi:hypothetical protein